MSDDAGPERADAAAEDRAAGARNSAPGPRREARKQVLLRLDPKVYDALARWASDELRSTNAQIEFLLRTSLSDAGRLPRHTGPLPRRGRPPKRPPEDEN
ncbi:hypothetical protein [Streptomyces candidus]|uniref:Uncharacterized protein n=1 Tax=Streptomyces candidus TaxID=67283 RepID=A0A7X0LPU5_9ACTN|nr:hypothetical protein [Streptomyces candidus]MBB6435226.1 hypothetical protein [Streptomyces candidus]GHH40384.1 hypothetical protein GCM10018773_21390 [Streptomyces candidus]